MLFYTYICVYKENNTEEEIGNYRFVIPVTQS